MVISKKDCFALNLHPLLVGIIFLKVDNLIDLWGSNKFGTRPQRFISEIADVHGHKFTTCVSLLVICLPTEQHIFPHGSLIKLIWKTAGWWNWSKKAVVSFLSPCTFSIKPKQYLKSKMKKKISFPACI